tara:strand:- start:138 stop:548 length:411 start_codon:yes stop_codon:yes gene_type:complete
MTEFKGDKRSKAYKEWKKNHAESSKGFGDQVEKFTKATGIKKFVKFVAGDDCGCDERKDKLNYLFPTYKPNCLTEDEYNYLADRVGKLNKVTSEEQRALLNIYNRVFNDRKELTGCSSCFLNGVWKKLERVYKEYI